MTFVDTGAFCAFTDRSDTCHALAVRQFSLLLKNQRPLVTTNFIIDETYTWIRYRLGVRPALEFLNRIRQSESHKPPLNVVTVTSALENHAVKLLEKYSDQDLSYTDATSLALIRERKLSQAFTFDKHFYLAAVEIIPGIVR